MTLVEFLVVGTVIFVLAVWLLPTNPGRGRHQGIAGTKLDMAAINAAIRQYEGTYNHLPFVYSNTNDDVTFGIDSADLEGFHKLNGTRLLATNSDLMLILMDIDQGVNAGHKMNPQRHQFITPRITKDARHSPGVSTFDYQYRDPWGYPYIISLDANSDGRIRDACYASAIASLNPASLSLTNCGGFFELDGNVMIWSRGPDGRASMTSPANTGVNKDNVFSWR